MRRIPVESLAAGERLLDPAASRHLCRVLRAEPGDRFLAFDPAEGLEAEGRLLAAGPRARVRLSPPRPASLRSSREVTLLHGLAKAERPDEVVAAATALGATRVIFLLTGRTVPRPDDGRAAERRQRWRRVAVQAARQCGRGDLPALEGPHAFDEIVAADPARALPPLRLVLHAEAGVALTERVVSPAPLCLLVGPEGGLSDPELRSAETAGFEPVSLGPFVLRTELAAVVALGVVAALGAVPPAQHLG